MSPVIWGSQIPLEPCEDPKHHQVQFWRAVSYPNVNLALQLYVTWSLISILMFVNHCVWFLFQLMFRSTEMCFFSLFLYCLYSCFEENLTFHVKRNENIVPSKQTGLKASVLPSEVCVRNLQSCPRKADDWFLQELLVLFKVSGCY